MVWQSVSSDEDLVRLDKTFGGFHDACLREIHVWTNHYVDDELQMTVPGDLDNSAKLLFQRQFRHPAAIELEFFGLTRLVLAPTADNCDSVIEGARVGITDQGDFILDIDMSAPSPVADCKAELIVAGKRLRWRELEWLGSRLKYRSAGDE